jgi:hypothetical protein
MEEWYVVVEFNQASGRPKLCGDAVYDGRETADDDAEDPAATARRANRRETYRVFRLDED